MFEKFSASAKVILRFAQEEAFSLHYAEIGPDLLLLGLLRDKESRAIEILQALSVDEAALYQRMRAMLVSSEPLPAERTVSLSEEGRRVISRIVRADQSFPDGCINSEHVLLSLLQEERGLALKLLHEAGVTIPRVHEQQKLFSQTSQAEILRKKKLARLRNYFMVGWLILSVALFYLFMNSMEQIHSVILRATFALFQAAPFLLAQPRPEWLPWLALLVGFLGYALWFLLLFPLFWAYGVLFPHLYRKKKVPHVFRKWLRAHCLKNGINMLTLLVSLEAIYAIFIFFPSTWWLWSALYYALFSLALTYTQPMLLFSLLYNITPIGEGPLLERFKLLLKQTNTHLDSCYLLESKGQKLAETFMAANVFLMNWGRQKHIIVTDYVYHKFPIDEVEVIFAHELGHLVHYDIPKRALLRAFFVGIFLFVCQLGMGTHVDPGLRLIYFMELIALDPIKFAVIGYILFFVLYYLYQWFHRYDEHRADEYALQVTQNAEVFKRAMVRLSNATLLPVQQTKGQSFLATHPSLANRLKHADDFAKKKKAAQSL